MWLFYKKHHRWLQFLNAPTRGSGQRGFTLVEMIVVIAVVGIMAALTIPMINVNNKEVRERAARNTVKMVQRQIDIYYVKNQAWPDNIQAEWFASAKLSLNPLHPDHPKDITDDVDGTNKPNKWHPKGKTTAKWPFWYNRLNGAFRIRVPQQGNDSETLALYNRVNGTDASSLTDTSL